MLRAFLLLVIALLLAGTGVFIAVRRSAPPTVTIEQPGRLVGQKGELRILAAAPGARFTSLTATLEQGGRSLPLFALDAPGSAAISQPGPDELRVVRPLGKADVPDLRQGPARIVVTASRATFLNLREVTASASKDIEVRLEPPRLAVVSTHHYVNHGGSEMVVYRVTPPDTASGVRVGDVEYVGFPASGAGLPAGAGLPGADPSLKVAFFALLYDQDLRTPIVAFARDDVGNEAHTSFVDNVFEKPFRRSRIDVDDRFFGRVVPEILEHAPELDMPAPSGSGPSGDLLAGFLRINGDLRRLNTERILALAAGTSSARLWTGPFAQLGNSQVEASFADHRTYVYKGKDIDQQVHLGFDLAVTAGVPVLAANDGAVIAASWLGIYGNCVILDHGMGVLSLYGHLSSLEVKVGDRVAKGHRLGRSGMTGLAGGDHLHFTMLVGGHPVNPVEWWDAHWIEDRVERKLREGTGAGAAPGASR